MVQRWVASAWLLTEKHFRRIDGHASLCDAAMNPWSVHSGRLGAAAFRCRPIVRPRSCDNLSLPGGRFVTFWLSGNPVGLKECGEFQISSSRAWTGSLNAGTLAMQSTVEGNLSGFPVAYSRRNGHRSSPSSLLLSTGQFLTIASILLIISVDQHHNGITPETLSLKILLAGACLLGFGVVLVFRKFRIDNERQKRLEQELRTTNDEVVAALTAAREGIEARNQFLIGFTAVYGGLWGISCAARRPFSKQS